MCFATESYPHPQVHFLFHLAFCVFFFFESRLVVLRAYSQFCAPGSLLVDLWDHLWCSGSNPGQLCTKQEVYLLFNLSGPHPCTFFNKQKVVFSYLLQCDAKGIKMSVAHSPGDTYTCILRCVCVLGRCCLQSSLQEWKFGNNPSAISGAWGNKAQHIWQMSTISQLKQMVCVLTCKDLTNQIE